MRSKEWGRQGGNGVHIVVGCIDKWQRLIRLKGREISISQSSPAFLPGNFIIFSLEKAEEKVSSHKLIMNHLSTDEKTLVSQCFSWNFSNSKVNFDPGQINCHNFTHDVTTTTREICKKSEQLQWFFLVSRFVFLFRLPPEQASAIGKPNNTL